jgi:membrane protein implicated in regulation of membrane protease activity
MLAGRWRLAIAAAPDMILSMVLLTSSILGLGDSPSSFGMTLALAITFLGIGLVANVLIVYVVGQVLAERKQNQERQEQFRQSRTG